MGVCVLLDVQYVRHRRRRRRHLQFHVFRHRRPVIVIFIFIYAPVAILDRTCVVFLYRTCHYIFCNGRARARSPYGCINPPCGCISPGESDQVSCAENLRHHEDMQGQSRWADAARSRRNRSFMPQERPCIEKDHFGSALRDSPGKSCKNGCRPAQCPKFGP